MLGTVLVLAKFAAVYTEEMLRTSSASRTSIPAAAVPMSNISRLLTVIEGLQDIWALRWPRRSAGL